MVVYESEINNFPQIQFFYDTIIHKKIKNSDIVMAIPKGDKYLVWIDNNVFRLLKLDGNKIINTEEFKLENNKIRSTIISGIICEIGNMRFFCISELLYFNGYTYKQGFVYALKKIKSSGILDSPYKNIMLTVPCIFRNFYELLKETIELPYQIEFIKFINKDRAFFLKYYKPKKDVTLPQKHPRSQIYLIKPDISPDTYFLYSIGKNKTEFVDVACVPDYKTSVMLNSIFRNIKENRNLDSLEESDDEDEFEDVSASKFLKSVEVRMKCEYNSKFKKWVPMSIL